MIVQLQCGLEPVWTGTSVNWNQCLLSLCLHLLGAHSEQHLAKSQTMSVWILLFSYSHEGDCAAVLSRAACLFHFVSPVPLVTRNQQRC